VVEKHYIDHQINSIQNFFAEDTLDIYQFVDVNVYQENLFHTKMMLKDFDLSKYIFGSGVDEFSSEEQTKISELLQREMQEIFYGRNLPKMTD